MRLTRCATRDKVTTPSNEHLPDGIDGTITGGAMESIGLLEILERGVRGASRGGAVSGAAQIAADRTGRIGRAERGIALSDGSRICFASIANADLFRDDDWSSARGGQAPIQHGGKAPAPRQARPRAVMNARTRTAGTHRARVLDSV
jgi:hypothetical protein